VTIRRAATVRNPVSRDAEALRSGARRRARKKPRPRVWYNPGMGRTTPITERDILDRVLSVGDGALSPEAARSLLALQFPTADTNRIRSLLRKNNAGKITAEERVALDKYLRVGQFLDLLHAKARAIG
jgi:hypothetical protein